VVAAALFVQRVAVIADRYVPAGHGDARPGVSEAGVVWIGPVPVQRTEVRVPAAMAG
jgi:hypothetical protein